MNKRKIGALNEDIALSFLRKKGYKILNKNFRCKFAEIDLIALFENTYIFVEVKARKNFSFGLPQESVNRGKQLKIRRAAEYYLASKKVLGDYSCRFDVIAIHFDDSNAPLDINHIENAF